MKPSWVVLTLLSTGFVLSVRSQNYIRFPIAGGGVTPTPVAAANAALAPEKITTDGKGNIYFVSLNCVFKMDAAGTITRVAGSGQYRGFAGDGGPAADALLSTPIGLAVDKRGNLYIVDSGNLRVRRVAPDGTIATVAGSGRATGGSVGDGGKATDASFALPYGIALDSAGNIYVSDMDSGRVRRIATDGTIGTFAGSGSADEGHACSAGSGRGGGGSATSALLCEPTDLAMDSKGNLYIGTRYAHVVRKIATDGKISRYGGSCASASSWV